MLAPGISAIPFTQSRHSSRGVQDEATVGMAEFTFVPDEFDDAKRGGSKAIGTESTFLLKILHSMIVYSSLLAVAVDLFFR